MVIWKFDQKNGGKGDKYVDIHLVDELTEYVSQELDKAREEGIKEVLSKIKEIFETNIPRGLYSPSETSYLYERFGGAIQQYYIDELSKLKDNK
jgi:hypothetical protein